MPGVRMGGLGSNVLGFSKIVARLALSQAPDRRESRRTPNPGKVVEAIHKLHSDHDRSLPQFVDDMVENVEMRGVFAIGEGVRHRFGPRGCGLRGMCRRLRNSKWARD
jgi:hypothetical protein